jgi:peptidoglycan hydrolase-like protein with peptidoglycan-binding domain
MNRSIIKVGSTDRKSVIEIQKIVGATPDGIFGPKTQRLVAAWQSENYLVADGIVGPKTMEAMGILDTDNQSANFTPQFRK